MDGMHPPPPPAALADRLAAAACAALRGGRPAEALPALDRLRLLSGQAGTAEALRGEALLALGRAEEADAAAEAALAAAPWEGGRLQLRARAHLACGRRLEALDAAAAAVMADAADPAAGALFGMLLLEERRFDEAIHVLGGALRDRPDDPALQLRLGLAFLRAGRHEAAEELLDHCAAAAPGLPGIALARAQAACARGAVDRAIALAREGLERNGPDAQLYCVLAHALEAAGRREESGPAFRAAARLAPQDPYLAHLAATVAGDTTDRATEGYVETVFDGYASRFEASLLALGYRVPGLVRLAVDRHLPAVAAGEARLGPVLDLGCGTGLVAAALHDLLGGPLVGIDLSRRMLEQARAKGVYTALRQAELGVALREDPDHYALIVAADVFCYLGRLDEVLARCRARLASDGLLVFSVERGEEGGGWRLNGQGRYVHAPDLVRADLAAAGLEPLEFREEALRLDRGRAVEGLFVVARRAPDRG